MAAGSEFVSDRFRPSGLFVRDRSAADDADAHGCVPRATSMIGSVSRRPWLAGTRRRSGNVRGQQRWFAPAWSARSSVTAGRSGATTAVDIYSSSTVRTPSSDGFNVWDGEAIRGMTKVSVVGAAGRSGPPQATTSRFGRCGRARLRRHFRTRKTTRSDRPRTPITARPTTRTRRSRQGDYEDTAGSDVVVITAGIPRQPGQTRIDLAGDNAPIMEDIGSSLAEHNDDFITVTTSNPVDLLNRHLYETGERAREKVIGFGGRLDSARFRYVISQRFDAPVQNVEATILGEHGATRRSPSSRRSASTAETSSSTRTRKRSCSRSSRPRR